MDNLFLKNNNASQHLKILALTASLFALCVIGLGAFTRLVNAGLGCPDWPGCYGHFIVPLTDSAKQLAHLYYPSNPLETYKAWAEMIHRYFVAGLSLFILAIIFFIFKTTNLRTKRNIILAFILIIVLIYQILLGKFTVTLKLMPFIVTQHLLGGFLTLSILWLIFLNNSKANYIYPVFRYSDCQKVLPWAWIALFLLVIQISLGAWTSTNYAALSCPDFPFCIQDQKVIFNLKEAFTLFPQIGINYEGGILSDSARQTIHMIHRIGAFILTIYLFILLSIAFRYLKKSLEFMKLLYLMMGLLFLQICVGITNVIFKLPLFSAISHNLIAMLLLLTVITFLFKLTTTNQRVRS